jgi:hypothetical protein
VNDGDGESFDWNYCLNETRPRVLGYGPWPSCGPLLKWTMAGERLGRPAVIVVVKMRRRSSWLLASGFTKRAFLLASLMVWGGFLNPPGSVKEGTSGLGNPLHGFLLSTTTE